MACVMVKSISDMTEQLPKPSAVCSQRENEKKDPAKSAQMFKFIFISLSFAGYTWNPYSGTRSCCCSIFCRIFSLICLLLATLQTLISFPCYRTASTTPEITSIISSQLMCVTIVLLWFRGLTLSRLIKKFTNFLDEIREDCTFEKTVSYTKLSRQMNIAVICWNVATALSFPAFMFAMFINDDATFGQDTCLNNPLGEQSIFASSLQILTMIASFQMAFSVTAALSLYALICLILITEYRQCSKVLAEMTSKSVGESDIDTCSRRHAAITRLNDSAGEILSGYVGMGYTAAIFIACMVVFNSISPCLNPSVLVQAIYFTYGSLIHLVVLTYFGIKVHTAAHSPLDVLHGLEGRKMSDRVIGLVTLFTNRLSQTQFGISVMGLFVINKGTVLALVGTLLTYVFIAIQFKPEENCSNLLHSNVSVGL